MESEKSKVESVVTLAKVAELNPRVSGDLRPDALVSFVPMASVSEESASVVSEETRVASACMKGFTPFKQNDVLVAKITPCFENGKIVIANIAHEFGFGSTEFHVIRPKEGVLHERYLLHCLRQPYVRLQGQRRMTGSAGQRRVPAQFLSTFALPLPTFKAQRRIAEILDRAEALRAKRRAALALLDELTQSIFLDLFGDPKVNPKQFPIKVLSELYINSKEGTKCGPFGSALKKHEYVEFGVPVWNMDNIDLDGRVVLPFRMWITESKFRKLEAYSVQNGDIIISRAGTVGKMCVTNLGSHPSIISTNLIRLRLGPKLLPLYFVSLMTYCRESLGRLKTGTDGAFTHMSTGILDMLRFPYPPHDLQQRYAAIVCSLDRQKKTMLSHLGELDQLFASLQHRAFRGEL